MENIQSNPLAKHFRRPAIYFKLPSGGRYWGENCLDIPANGEIPVYPMTTADEITLKTPDALLNGSAIVSVIQSCCPNIKDAWLMPSIDVDAALIAVRIASYGSTMEVSSVCPSCNEEHEYDIDLSQLTSQVKCPNYSTPVDYDGLKIKLKPQKYVDITKTNMVRFEEEKIAQVCLNVFCSVTPLCTDKIWLKQARARRVSSWTKEVKKYAPVSIWLQVSLSIF